MSGSGGTKNECIALLLGALLSCGYYNTPDAIVTEVHTCVEDPGGPISRGRVECRVTIDDGRRVTVCGAVAVGDCILRDGAPGTCWHVGRACNCTGGCDG